MVTDTAAELPSVLLVHPVGDPSPAMTGAYESLTLGSLAANLRAQGHRADLHDLGIDGGGVAGAVHRADGYQLVVTEALYRTMPEVAALARALSGVQQGEVKVSRLESMFAGHRVVPRNGGSVPAIGVLGLGVRARPDQVLHEIPEIGFVLAECDRTPHPAPVRNPSRVVPRGVIDVEATRGCTHHCSFCSVAARGGRRVDRHWVPRPPAEVVAEIEVLVARTGVHRVAFVDDNLLGSPRAADAWLSELVDLVRTRELSMAFSAYLRADDCTSERVALLVEAGLVQAHVGIESGSDRVLARLRKGTTRTKQEAGVLSLRSSGVHVVPSLITFEPRQDLSELEESLAWIERLGLERGFGPHGLIPLPGAAATRELEDAGLLEWSAQPWALPVATVADAGVRRVLRALTRLEDRVDRHAPGWREQLVARRFAAEDRMAFLDPGGAEDLIDHDRFRRAELHMCLSLTRTLRAKGTADDQ